MNRTGDVLRFGGRVFISPKTLFEEMSRGMHFGISRFYFALAAVIVGIKGGFLLRPRASYLDATATYFDGTTFGTILSFVERPDAKTILVYLMFFAFVGVIRGFLKIFKSGGTWRTVLHCLMAISVVGVVFQVVFSALAVVLHPGILHTLSYGIYFWTMGLTVVAVAAAGQVSIRRALVLVVGDAVFFLLLLGMTVPVPYLTWLGVIR